VHSRDRGSRPLRLGNDSSPTIFRDTSSRDLQASASFPSGPSQPSACGLSSMPTPSSTRYRPDVYSPMAPRTAYLRFSAGSGVDLRSLRSG